MAKIIKQLLFIYISSVWIIWNTFCRIVKYVINITWIWIYIYDTVYLTS
jgi:hypothetical protein